MICLLTINKSINLNFSFLKQCLFKTDNLNNNPDDVEIDLTETNFNSVPDYVAMEIPLDKEQYSLNLNTGVDTSQDEDKSEKVEQFDKEQYSSNLNTNVKTSQDGIFSSIKLLVNKSRRSAPLPNHCPAASSPLV
jgi:hypothetical protein